MPSTNHFIFSHMCGACANNTMLTYLPWYYIARPPLCCIYPLDGKVMSNESFRAVVPKQHPLFFRSSLKVHHSELTLLVTCGALERSLT
jgi:hypothetical protein